MQCASKPNASADLRAVEDRTEFLLWAYYSVEDVELLLEKDDMAFSINRALLLCQRDG